MAPGRQHAPILQIITNPNRGSNAAYALTANGVFHIADSNQTDPVPTAMKQWVKVTGNLLTTQSNLLFNNPLLGTSVLTSYLTSMAIDWRYQIPNNATATATATAQLGSINGVSTGGLGLIVIDNGGAGYSSANPPTVTISGGGGTGATGAAVVNSSGVITGISFTGVLSIDSATAAARAITRRIPPLVTISVGGGSGATATAVVNSQAYRRHHPDHRQQSRLGLHLGPDHRDRRARQRRPLGDAPWRRRLGRLGLHVAPRPSRSRPRRPR